MMIQQFTVNRGIGHIYFLFKIIRNLSFDVSELEQVQVQLLPTITMKPGNGDPNIFPRGIEGQ
jgi:hypothetical protein